MWSNFKDWLSQPYSDDMDAAHWFYWLGLIIVLSVLWRLILNHLKELG